MRRLIVVTALVLAVALALCVLSTVSVQRVVAHARHLRSEAVEAMEREDVQQAEVTMTELAAYLKESEGWLEVLCSHEDLHDIKEHLIDAKVSIEFGIIDDFYQAISKFGEKLEHIADVESVRLSNLY